MGELKKRGGVMKMKKCTNCNEVRGFSRKWGIGTIIMFLATLGLWIFVMPFYPVRCITCGGTSSIREVDEPIVDVGDLI